MIKQCPIDFNLPRSKENTIQMAFPHDLSYPAFKAAWTLVCNEKNKLMFPKHVICNWLDSEFVRILSLAISGDVLVANTKDYDEWWITFCDANGNDLDVIFYSPGA